MIVLDTAYLIDFFKGKKETLGAFEIKEIDALDIALDFESDIVTTVVSFHEIMSGVKHKKVKKEERYFRRFFTETPVLDFDFKAAEKSSEIMAGLLTIGRPVNPLDVLIAGIAVTNGADKIATTDKRFDDISKVTGLEILGKRDDRGR
ncbi:MAG: type II toxin-antitoxin system VapC family toxin [Candidatus Methanoperedens sp.]|nr:type II toxin-antitoxin system VapC family toxin [Candidatus Methanoperedens sp.]